MQLYSFIAKFVIPNIHEYVFFKESDEFLEDLLHVPMLKNDLSGNSENVIHETAAIHESAIIMNSIIGKNVKIHEGVTIRDSIVLDESNIGHCSEISRSILLRDCKITRFNYVGNSLLGENITLISGAGIATERYDKKNIIINGGDERWDTNYYKFGAIIGNNTSIGFCSKLNPGVIIGTDSIIDSHLQINEYVPPNSILYLDYVIKKSVINK